MLHILFFILKTIGIILISILGILLILALIVLFVPIRYQVEAKKYEDIQGYVKVHWILRILYFRLKYEKEKIQYQFRIFGFIIKDSHRPEKIKSQKSKRVKKTKSKRKHSKEIKRSKKVAKIEKGENKHTALDIRNNEGLDIRENEEKSNVSSENEEQNKNIQGNNEKTKSIRENDIKDYQKKTNLENKKISIWEKLRSKVYNFYQKIKNIIAKIQTFFNRLKLKLIELNLTRESIIYRFHLIKTFLTDEINKAGIKKIWLSIKKITRHIFPKRVEANIHFGTGDPCSTGQVLGVISLTYHLYQKSVKIIPDFNEEILEGHINAKGRIRLFTLAIICIKLLLDKNFKQLLKSYQELKEEL
ncbi:DUF2953 family protein [Mobilisporobacter senegalensis]|uniref:DUF2953 family protein n=2 Tax=Mobilisporobacter senegalensis TaxID=1329262 RepID=A0A3N1XWZ9_9FIRM|nr:DUF2953 family protein [Mobilisporobacter senegalensis]